MTVVPGSPAMCETPSRRSASSAIRAPFTCSLPRASAEHDVDRLELGVAEQLLQALLAADPGLLDPAERHPGEMTGRAIDPPVPGVERPGHPVGPAEIVGPDAPGQPVGHGVGDLDGFFLFGPGER